MEQAGGMATTGTRRILGLQPMGCHGRSPIFLGSDREIEKIIELYKEAAEHPKPADKVCFVAAAAAAVVMSCGCVRDDGHVLGAKSKRMGVPDRRLAPPSFVALVLGSSIVSRHLTIFPRLFPSHPCRRTVGAASLIIFS